MNHGIGEYVRGSVHMNSIEGFWSLFKGGYCGIHHRMAGEHLHRYLNEFTGRAGFRSIDTMDQMENTVGRMVGKTLT